MYQDNFQELLKWVKDNRLAAIERLTIQLDNARTDSPLEVAGLTIYVQDATDVDTLLQVRLNEQESGQVDLVKNYGITFPFYRLYLTNTAQPGKTITLLIGRAAPFSIADNRSTVDIVSALETISEQLTGASTGTYGADQTVGVTFVKVLNANATRKSAIIQSDLSNTGVIYIGFSNAVSSSRKVVAILPGGVYSVDDYAGAIYAVSGTAGQKVSASEV